MRVPETSVPAAQAVVAARGPSRSREVVRLEAAAALVDWDDPTASTLTKLAEAIAAVMADPSADSGAKGLATQFRQRLEPHVNTKNGELPELQRLKSTYLAMSIDSLKVTAQVIEAIHHRSSTGEPQAATPHQAALARPKPQPRAKAAPATPHKTKADKQSERLQQRAVRASSQAEARAAHKAARDASRAKNEAAPPDPLPAPPADAESEKARGGVRSFFQRVTTSVAVARAGQEGRQAEAVLPEVERKLSKRAGEVTRLQSGLSRSERAKARDAEAEDELAALQETAPERRS